MKTNVFSSERISTYAKDGEGSTTCKCLLGKVAKGFSLEPPDSEEVDRAKPQRNPAAKGGHRNMAKDENASRNLWRLARVQEVFPKKSLTWAILISIGIKRKQRLQTFA